mmetsp:Transcript_13893/g.41943  ORF Transcript_13893/g.41943 Transcript_13893/m.41943 type:complete len:412 (-) Transcript_13893:1257-2492(-)
MSHQGEAQSDGIRGMRETTAVLSTGAPVKAVTHPGHKADHAAQHSPVAYLLPRDGASNSVELASLCVGSPADVSGLVEDLPDTVLAEIFALLPWDEVVANCATVCRSWHHAARHVPRHVAPGTLDSLQRLPLISGLSLQALMDYVTWDPAERERGRQRQLQQNRDHEAQRLGSKGTAATRTADGADAIGGACDGADDGANNWPSGYYHSGPDGRVQESDEHQLTVGSAGWCYSSEEMTAEDLSLVGRSIAPILFKSPLLHTLNLANFPVCALENMDPGTLRSPLRRLHFQLDLPLFSVPPLASWMPGLLHLDIACTKPKQGFRTDAGDNDGSSMRASSAWQAGLAGIQAGACVYSTADTAAICGSAATSTVSTAAGLALRGRTAAWPAASFQPPTPDGTGHQFVNDMRCQS